MLRFAVEKLHNSRIDAGSRSLDDAGVARLLVVEGPWRGLELVLAPPQRLLGRGEGCDLALADKALSREHCAFVLDDGAWRVEDLGSTNGLAVNGAKVTSARLLPGDLVTVGHSVLRFVDDAEIELKSARDNVTATLQIPAREAIDRRGESGWRAEDYAALIDFSESLALASGPAEIEGLAERWITGQLGGGSATLFRRRHDRWVRAVSSTGPEGRTIDVSAEVLQAVAEEGRTAFLAATAADSARTLVPIGRPPSLVMWVDELRRPPDETRLAVVAHAARLTAAHLERAFRPDARPESEPSMLIAESSAMRAVLDFVDRVAAVEATVLVLGESGTGKELVARSIHQRSSRAEGPFIAVNCGALPEGLIESELFGHEKGAFTGASVRRAGRFERAHRGTLFLDEIGDLPLAAQARLLRVLEDRSVERLGGRDSTDVDVRVVAATHRDLRSMVHDGRFREDLYYRLSVLVLELPPLRARPGDVELIARRFVEEAAHRARREVPGIAPGVLECLRRYEWPGNVRELRNAIERAVVLGRGPTIAEVDLPAEIRAASSGNAPGKLTLPLPLAELVRLDVIAALEAAAGNKSKAARILGIDRATLYARLKDYGLEA